MLFLKNTAEQFNNQSAVVSIVAKYKCLLFTGYGSAKHGTCPMAHLLTDCTGDKFKILPPPDGCMGDHDCPAENQKCCKNSCKQYVCVNATMPTKPPQGNQCVRPSPSPSPCMVVYLWPLLTCLTYVVNGCMNLNGWVDG